MLTGNWVFNQTLTQPTDWTSENLQFHRYDDATATYDTINYSGGTNWTVTLEPDPTGTEGYIEYLNNSGGWNMADPSSPIITITNDDLVSQEFVTWFLDNASEYLPPGPIKIEYGGDVIEDIWADIDDDGYTLETAGKILANDITISADYSKIPLEEGSFDTNGTYYPQNTFGFSAVTVDVSGSTLPEVVPTFTGGSVVPVNSGSSGKVKYGSLTLGGTNVTASTASSSNGVLVTLGGSLGVLRESITYSNAVDGHINKSAGDVALAAAASRDIALTDQSYYITAITVPANKILNVVNNGTTNVNGGLADKGVQIKSNKEVIVDNMTNFPVTYSATTTVNGITYSAGDLKVPVYSPTSSSLEFPSGFATPTATTATVTGQITSINGAQIKDTSSNIVKGSSTLTSTATYTSYLAKFTDANTVSTGPQVSITTVTPTSTTGYRAGDIIFVVS